MQAKEATIVCGRRHATRENFAIAARLGAGAARRGLQEGYSDVFDSTEVLHKAYKDGILNLDALLTRWPSLVCRDLGDREYGVIDLLPSGEAEQIKVNYKRTVLQLLVEALPIVSDAVTMTRSDRPFQDGRGTTVIAASADTFVRELRRLVPSELSIEHCLGSKKESWGSKLRLNFPCSLVRKKRQLRCIAVGSRTRLTSLGVSVETLAAQPRVWVSIVENNDNGWEFLYSTAAPHEDDIWFKVSAGRFLVISKSDIVKAATGAEEKASNREVTFSHAFLPGSRSLQPPHLPLGASTNRLRDVHLPDPHVWLQRIMPQSAFTFIPPRGAKATEHVSYARACLQSHA